MFRPGEHRADGRVRAGLHGQRFLERLALVVALDVKGEETRAGNAVHGERQARLAGTLRGDGQHIRAFCRFEQRLDGRGVGKE